jgi:hypothetical protein
MPYISIQVEAKECEICKKLFPKPVSCSILAWSNRRYCSRECASKAKVGSIGWLRGKERPYASSGSFKKGHETWNKGMKCEHITAEKHPAWRGDEATMVAQHNWIVRRLGRPQKCEMCGTTEDRMYHWANISHQYKRDASDYIRLCVPCHKRYDLDKISREGRSEVSIKNNSHE